MDWVSIIPLLFCCFLGLVSLGMLAMGIWSLSWPRAKGRVELSFLDKESTWKQQKGRQTYFYKAETEEHCLAYAYEVAGEKYLGSKIRPWGDSNWSVRSGVDEPSDSGKTLWSGARDAAKWYRPGASVDVYYCPWRPQWACLEPGGLLVPLVIGGVAMWLYFGYVR